MTLPIPRSRAQVTPVPNVRDTEATARVIPSYTRVVKTAISVPEEIYARAERAARKLGLNRSQFYSAAAERLAAEVESADVTAAIDAVVDAVNADSSTQFAITAGTRLDDDPDSQW